MVQSDCVPKFSPLGGPVFEILADVTFVIEKRMVAFHAKRKAQTEVFGLSKALHMFQSVCVPKFSPLGGAVFEILADVTLVTDERTHAWTH